MEVLHTTPPHTPTKLVPDAPKKKKKKKLKSKCPCIINGETCNQPLSLAIGHCKWCNISFCISCRMPEVHKCSNLDDLKNNRKEQNTQKLKDHKCHLSQIELQSKS